jgi:pimeloyl-ACP methyl ester carboxylesterase
VNGRRPTWYWHANEQDQPDPGRLSGASSQEVRVPTGSPELSSLLPSSSVLPSGDRHQVPTGDGGLLHAVAAGAGRPLVLTHGALLSLEAWALLWQPPLAAGHRLIAYDLRGHGRSTLGRSGFGVQAYAQDLAAVLDHFDVRRGVVAHSTGGIGALALAVTAPAGAGGRLAGQVLIFAAPQGLGDSRQNRLLARSCSLGWCIGCCAAAGWARCSPARCLAPARPGPGGVRAPHHGGGAAADDHRRGQGGVALRLP